MRKNKLLCSGCFFLIWNSSIIAHIQKKAVNGSRNINKKSNLEKNIDSGLKVTSPIVGTAYLAAEPGAKKFVEEGQKIKKGQTIMIIEAMKTMNHVPSTQDGVVSKILVKDGEPVEFGQALISLK